MPRPRKRRRCMVEEEPEAQSETQDLISAPVSIEEVDSSSSSTCSSSFPSSFCSSSSYYALTSSTSEEGLAASRTPSPSHSPPRAGSSCTAMISSPCSQLSTDSETEESLGSSEALPCAASLSKGEIDVKVDELVKYLLFKYLMKEPVTKAEMLNNIIRNYQDHFPVIFREASECMQLVFGIDMKEVEPAGHTYILVIALELTYDGMMTDIQGIPKTGLLIMVLSIIFMEGNCISEDMVWDVLNNIGLYAGNNHFIYGEPRKLITDDFVQEGYLEYRQVSGSHPPSYELLWGPRAYAETTKMKILMFLTSINGSDPRSYPIWYAEALRDEEERA
ncbi:melanoma-associated antigen 10-like [Peromyscus maniculatus bairdii]|uniref:MAGE family member A10 n=1 Tax=Peromyscus maniculatus bairdii TaxID=230844 RepID=A0A6J0EIW4_PERMB|nr:melanoma-associated antigen 10-like [Peromyscus maniculatus bairdii]XP_042125113.1 melanoma-associated antigen 10-like [Peromyscus maniculatus bairdii]